MNFTISTPDTQRLFHSSIAGYRNANAALDAAIASENWSAIEGAQNSRSRHAETIALIVNQHADTAAEEGPQP
jgi:hypothetical protein